MFICNFLMILEMQNFKVTYPLATRHLLPVRKEFAESMDNKLQEPEAIERWQVFLKDLIQKLH